MALAGLLTHRKYLRDDAVQATTSADLQDLQVPWRPILLIGLAMALFYAIDFGLSNWSALLLHDELGCHRYSARPEQCANFICYSLLAAAALIVLAPAFKIRHRFAAK